MQMEFLRGPRLRMKPGHAGRLIREAEAGLERDQKADIRRRVSLAVALETEAVKRTEDEKQKAMVRRARAQERKRVAARRDRQRRNVQRQQGGAGAGGAGGARGGGRRLTFVENALFNCVYQSIVAIIAAPLRYLFFAQCAEDELMRMGLLDDRKTRVSSPDMKAKYEKFRRAMSAQAGFTVNESLLERSFILGNFIDRTFAQSPRAFFVGAGIDILMAFPWKVLKGHHLKHLHAYFASNPALSNAATRILILYTEQIVWAEFMPLITLRNLYRLEAVLKLFPGVNLPAMSINADCISALWDILKTQGFSRFYQGIELQLCYVAAKLFLERRFPNTLKADSLMSLILSPFKYLEVRQQLAAGSEFQYGSVWQLVKRVHSESGIFGFYTGAFTLWLNAQMSSYVARYLWVNVVFRPLMDALLHGGYFRHR
mmetsp:Transcript_10502/g.25641  ORF Transcript_10502/g.25641 Transcript_10502/m.25641 type:complete len:429 (+) Transcript_10502:1-1287(+)